MRPHDLPSAEAYEHGTRARYVCGCRCEDCRASNTAAYHERQRRALAELKPGATSGPCPGVNGKPCPKWSRLRKDSKGGVCGRCRELVLWNGLVPAGRARMHLRELSRLGIGRRSVSAASDVATSILHAIVMAQKVQIRADTERRILAVDVAAVADHGLVDASETWKLLEQLLELGLTRYEIAAKLGSTAKTPALQLKRERVLAMNAQKVARLHRAIVDEFRQRFEVRDELEVAAELGHEWFDAEGYSFIRRGT